MNSDFTKVSNLIKDIKVAMMTTVSKEGDLHSRPMSAQELDEQGCLWFFTSDETGKVDSIQNDQRINLGYSDPKSSKYVSVSGVAAIVKDTAKAKELWTPDMKAWFPEGVTESDLVLIKVKIDSAEYWAAPAGKTVQYARIALAAITGQEFKPTPGEHGRVSLH